MSCLSWSDTDIFENISDGVGSPPFLIACMDFRGRHVPAFWEATINFSIFGAVS